VIILSISRKPISVTFVKRAGQNKGRAEGKREVHASQLRYRLQKGLHRPNWV
jgi:hypothetical protein